MPRIPDGVLDCVVFIYPSVESADAGEQAGATGFIVTIPSVVHSDLGYSYVVTNAHAIRGGATVVRLNTVSGRADSLDLKSVWTLHPDGDDIAVAPIGRSDKWLTRGVISTRCITHDYFALQNVGIGDEVYMVGRFVGRDARERNLPLIQRGVVASCIGAIENPETNHQQLSIIVELRSMSGYSGSPVFLDIYDGWLLGVNYCHLPIIRPVEYIEDSEQKETEYYVRIPSGMAACVPAWKLTELLSLEQFVKQREADDRRIAQAHKPPPVKLDDSGLPTQKTRAGIAIGVPTKSKILRDLKKASRRKPN